MASIRTAERARFQREVLLRSWQLVGGQPKDMFVYSRIRADLGQCRRTDRSAGETLTNVR